MSEDQELERFFAAARAAAPKPSDDLVGAVLRDAELLQPRQIVQAARRTSPWHEFWRGLGGWPAGAALAGAVIAGVALGYFSPDPLAGVSAALLESEVSGSADELFPGFDALMTEG